VHSLAEKRRRLDEETGTAAVSGTPSCARADARPLDRDVQMKYDIAKNEDGPLSRTVRPPELSKKAKGKQKVQKTEHRADAKLGLGQNSDGLMSDKHPGLDERLRNIETHLSVRYVPSPPRGLLDRLKFLENHIVQLEKEYPPWAALHFNQPKRGWPPPPRSTPIIVPAHMRLPTKDPPPQPSDPGITAKFKKSNSSLHRAVMERLEVKQAMSDLTAGSGSGG